MGLQLRLRHPLGQRMLDLPARGADRPVIVGRSSSADVQIPSTLVGPAHCLIVQQDGQWILQDAQSSTGTCVNGQQIDGPVFIGPGDIIQLGLGAGSPTLEVDPLRMDGGAAVGAAAGARPMAPTSPAAYAPQEAEAPAGEEAPAQEEGGDLAAAAGSASTFHPYYVPRQSMSPAAVTATVVSAVVILGVAILLYFQLKPKEEAPPPQQPVAKRPASVPAPAPKTIGPGPSSPRVDPGGQTPTATPIRPSRTGSGGTDVNDWNDTPPPPTDERKRTPEWEAVEESHQGIRGEPKDALLVYNNYRRSHPGLFTEELNQYEEESLDKLWWTRIQQIMREIAKADDDLAENQREIDRQPDGDYKTNTLLPKRQELLDAKKEQEQKLATRYDYKEKDIPNPNDADGLKKLRLARDADRYAKWKQTVLKTSGRVVP